MEIEIPFGAFDSELMHQEINIPEGFEATIEGDKIILTRIESEDEKIRKALVDFFYRGAENGEQTNGVCDKDILAWLEKQKERSPLSKDEEYTLARIIEYLEDNDCPSEWKYLLHDIYALSYQKEQNAWFKKQGEQKSVIWSEEDEVMIKVFDSIIRYIVEVVDKDVLERFGTNREELFSWLKSLKGRVQPQPKQEWSEEDETRIKNILSVLDAQVCWDGATGKRGNPYQKDIDWLKSLRPQNHWETSKEQMSRLKWIAYQKARRL